MSIHGYDYYKLIKTKMKQFTIIVALLATSSFLACPCVASTPLSEAANSSAKPINTAGAGGTITIVGKTDSKVYFVTAAHVVTDTRKGEELTVELEDGKQYQASILKDFTKDGVDIAVGVIDRAGKAKVRIYPVFALAPDAEWSHKFRAINLVVKKSCSDEGLTIFEKIECSGVNSITSSNPLVERKKTINVASTIEEGKTYERFSGVYNDMKYNLQTATIGPLAIAGYSLATQAINRRLLRVSEATIESYINKNQNGYDLVYSTVSTVPGMSGGPVLTSRVCPGPKGLYAGIIAIHGMSENYGDTNSRSGMSLGVPLASPTVRSYLTANSKTFGIPTGKLYAQLVASLCSQPYYRP